MVRTALADLRALATPATVRRGVACASLTLLVRLLTPAAVWAFFGPGLVRKLAPSLVVGAVIAVRSVAQKAWSARTEAELVDETAKSVLRGDTLQSSVLADEDARIEVIQAVYQTAQVLTQIAPSFVADVAAAAILGAWLVSKEPAGLVGVAGALVVAAGIALLLSRRAIESALDSAWQVQARAFDGLADAFDGRHEIAASGLGDVFLERLKESTSAWARAGNRAGARMALSGRLPLIATGGFVVALLLARKPAPFVSSMADIALLGSVAPVFAGVAQGMHNLVRGKRWVSVLARMRRATQHPPGGGQQPPSSKSFRIAFERVSFRYDHEASPALKAVDAAWEGAFALGVSGANGSGKSTFLRLMLGLALPSDGAITVDGGPLSDLDLDAWRRRVSFLPQRPYLAPRSDVRHAIRWPSVDGSDERALWAIDRVRLLDRLGAGGGDPLCVRVDSLSVGERQRVALARVLSRDASIYVLDEPDANLDRAGIALVGEMIRELARDRMVVFAAHTPELLAVADEIVALEAGRRVVSPRA